MATTPNGGVKNPLKELLDRKKSIPSLSAAGGPSPGTSPTPDPNPHPLVVLLVALVAACIIAAIIV